MRFTRYPIVFLLAIFLILPSRLFAADKTPPQGSIRINNNNPYTNSATAILTLSATDTGSGLSQMKFSNDNKNWSNPESYKTAKTWTLTSKDGKKTVYVKFKDNAGNWSVAYSDSIILDTTLPTGKILINKNAAKTNSIIVTLNIAAVDTGSGLWQMQFSNDNATWSIPERYAVTKIWNLLPLNGLKTVYAKFQDKAGNWSKACSDTIIFYMPAPPAPAINKVTTPTNCNFQVISGTKSPDATTIIIISATASPQAVKIVNNISWTCVINALQEGTNTILAKATNSGGLESSPVNASIVLDTQGPSLDATSPTENEVIR